MVEKQNFAGNEFKHVLEKANIIVNRQLIPGDIKADEIKLVFGQSSGDQSLLSDFEN